MDNNSDNILTAHTMRVSIEGAPFGVPRRNLARSLIGLFL